MPMTRLTAIRPNINRVVAAFLDLGFLNAGTPLLIASTPVSAAQPEEKARNSRKSSAKPPSPGDWAGIVRFAVGACMLSPVAIRKTPQAIMQKTPKTKAYVGM